MLSGPPQQSESRQNTVIVFETEKGAIEMEVDGAHAPITAANFLKYVDGGFFDGGRVIRAVRPDNTVRHDCRPERRIRPASHEAAPVV